MPFCPSASISAYAKTGRGPHAAGPSGSTCGTPGRRRPSWNSVALLQLYYRNAKILETTRMERRSLTQPSKGPAISSDAKRRERFSWRPRPTGMTTLVWRHAMSRKITLPLAAAALLAFAAFSPTSSYARSVAGFGGHGVGMMRGSSRPIGRLFIRQHGPRHLIARRPTVTLCVLGRPCPLRPPLPPIWVWHHHHHHHHHWVFRGGRWIDDMVEESPGSCDVRFGSLQLPHQDLHTDRTSRVRRCLHQGIGQRTGGRRPCRRRPSANHSRGGQPGACAAGRIVWDSQAELRVRLRAVSTRTSVACGLGAGVLGTR